jgi:23S rRNA pseudouridine2605 synthase
VTVDPLTRLDPRRAHVVVDGVDEVTVRAPEYLVLHKPPGVVATMHDPGGRRCLSDLLGAEHRGLFHVGRLQADAAGVQILMSDGELAHRLTAGKKHLPHSYLVRIAGPTPPDLLARLRAGVLLDGEAVAVDGCRVVVNSASTSVLEVTLRHRDAHGARRLLTVAGHSVLQVVCTQIGPVVLGALEPGAFRPLTSDEVRRLEALGRQELSD